MAAGLGFKTFTTGEVLTAADTNGYLMQGVLVFASSAARASAITSPQEGQYSFLKDTDALEYYSGSAWVGAPVGDITAVTAGTGISGGGTSGAVTITNSMATEITAAGDIVVGTGSGTFDNLPIGTTAQVLTVDTTVSPYKVKWATAAGGGGMTLINSGGTTLTGASTVIGSIPTTYINLYVIIRNFRPSTDGARLRLRFNGITTATYNSTSSSSAATVAFGDTFMDISSTADDTVTTSLGQLLIPDYANASTMKTITGTFMTINETTTTSINNSFTTGFHNQTTAITSLTFLASSGNLSAGTVYVYGVM